MEDARNAWGPKRASWRSCQVFSCSLAASLKVTLRPFGGEGNDGDGGGGDRGRGCDGDDVGFATRLGWG